MGFLKPLVSASVPRMGPRMAVFLQMGEGLDYEFVYIAPQELMLQYFYVSFLFGICVTIPVLLYQAWAFIRPGLKKSENFLFLIAMIFGLLCFGR